MRRMLSPSLLAWSAAIALLTLAPLNAARAQVAVQLQTEKDTFLLYEAIPVEIRLHNISGRPIQLEGAKEHSWLTFVLNERNGGAVDNIGRLDTDTPVLIPAGETVSRRVNLLPLCDLRSRGSYRVQAQINVNGIQAVSEPLKFTILEGRTLWRETVGVPALEPGKDEYRTYTLLAHRGQTNDSLYVRVEDDPATIVYGVIPLGGYLTVTAPQVQVDRDAHMHVLFQNGPRSFDYVDINPRAKVVRHAGYSDLLSRPVLTKLEGVVNVTGGEQVYPRQERILTEEELNPPPLPAPKPKKKSWWPFGKKKDEEKERFADELPPTPKRN